MKNCVLDIPLGTICGTDMYLTGVIKHASLQHS